MAVADEQILAGSSATITGRFRDQDGDLVDPTGPVTVTVTRSDGTAVLTAAATTAPSGTVGVRQAALSAAQTATLDELTATWGDGTQAVTTRIEVVAAYYASVADIRSSDPALTDTGKYPSAAVVAARRLVETEFEDICGVAFVPRYRLSPMRASGATRVVLDDPMLRTVRYADGLTAPQLAAVAASADGVAELPSGTWPSTPWHIGYEHGFDRPPADVLGAFFTRVRDVLNRSNRGVPDRTSSFTSGENGGTFALIVPGQRGSKTGIPDVDVVLDRWSMRTPGIA